MFKFKKVKIMSDSETENSNLSDLEEGDAISVDENVEESQNQQELNGVLQDTEETEVKWSDLVS